MKLEDILKLDCSSKENKKILMEKLLETKPFQEYEPSDINFGLVEKMYKQLVKRTYINIGCIMPAHDMNYYTAFPKNWLDNKSLPLCYATSMLELYMKMFVYTYHMVKKNPDLRRVPKNA